MCFKDIEKVAEVQDDIMPYGSTPNVGMAPKKNRGNIESTQMTYSKSVLEMSALSSLSHISH